MRDVLLGAVEVESGSNPGGTCFLGPIDVVFGPEDTVDEKVEHLGSYQYELSRHHLHNFGPLAIDFNCYAIQGYIADGLR